MNMPMFVANKINLVDIYGNPANPYGYLREVLIGTSDGEYTIADEVHSNNTYPFNGMMPMGHQAYQSFFHPFINQIQMPFPTNGHYFVASYNDANSPVRKELVNSYNVVGNVAWIEADGTLRSYAPIKKSELSEDELAGLTQYIATFIELNRHLNPRDVNKTLTDIPYHYFGNAPCTVFPILKKGVEGPKNHIVVVKGLNSDRLVNAKFIQPEKATVQAVVNNKHVTKSLGEIIDCFLEGNNVKLFGQSSPIRLVKTITSDDLKCKPECEPFSEEDVAGDFIAKWVSSKDIDVPEEFVKDDNPLGFNLSSQEMGVVADALEELANKPRGKSIKNDPGVQLSNDALYRASSVSVVPGYSIKETEEEIIIITNKTVVVKRK